MRTLAINTALPLTEIAFIEGDKILLDKSWPSNFNESETVMPELNQILNDHGRDVDRLFVVEGPGSFTGLRIGITIANTFAYGLGCKIAAVNTFDYLRAKVGDAAMAIVLRAGGTKLALSLPGQSEPSFVEKEELADFLRGIKGLQTVITDMKDLDKNKIVLPNNMGWWELDQLSSLGTIFIDHFAKQNLNLHEQIKPVYLAPPQITQSKKPLFN